MSGEVYFLTSILAGAVLAGTPVFFAALGEVFAERSGVINIGLEGIMLLGAVMAIIVQASTDNSFLALFAAIIVGASVGFAHGVLSVYLNINQIAAGLVFFFLGRGLSGYLGIPYAGQKSTAI